jgi:hypothetical protein
MLRRAYGGFLLNHVAHLNNQGAAGDSAGVLARSQGGIPRAQARDRQAEADRKPLPRKRKKSMLQNGVASKTIRLQDVKHRKAGCLTD